MTAAEASKQQQLAESPFSVSFRMLDGYGADVQITMREGVTTEIVKQVFDARRAFVDLATGHGWTFAVAAKPQPAPVAAAAPTMVAQQTTALNGGAWTPPAPTGPVAANVAGGGFASKPRESFVAVKMDVTPRADGKFNVNFYAEGHKFPDIYVTKSGPEMVGALIKCGAWSVVEHFSGPGSYDLPGYVIEYTLSDKKNSKGNPYKDLADIRPVAA